MLIINKLTFFSKISSILPCPLCLHFPLCFLFVVVILMKYKIKESYTVLDIIFGYVPVYNPSFKTNVSLLKNI